MLLALKAWVAAMTVYPAEPSSGGTAGSPRRLWVKDSLEYTKAFDLAVAAIKHAEEDKS
jgi:hypothetical protein